MFSKMKLGAKIAYGFGAIIFLAFVLGGIAVVSMMGAEKSARKIDSLYVEEVEIVSQLEGFVRNYMFNMRGYAFSEDKKYLDLAAKDIGLIKESIAKASKLAEKYPELVILGKNSKALLEKMTEYENLSGQTVEKIGKLNEIRTQMGTHAENYLSHCYEYLNNQKSSTAKDIDANAGQERLHERFAKIHEIQDVIDRGNAIRIANLKSQSLRDPEIVKKALADLDEVGKDIAAMRTTTRLEVNIKHLDSIQAAAEGYKKGIEELLAVSSEMAALTEKRTSIGISAIELANQASTAALDETKKLSGSSVTKLKAASYVLVIGLISVLGIGIVFAFFIITSITRPISRVIEGLGEGANQVAAAAGQVASGSQSLAEGASEQAASLEETSSALEEMSSMTKCNADNASQADGLMKESENLVRKASSSMTELTKSIGEVADASQQTQKIIKTIDEIAFQTNLLALNAAVEAARAGEAGAGFAVVAEEVRNLALRSADAAKNTAALIEDTVKKVNDGSRLLEQTNQAFDEVRSSASKVASLVSEIAGASDEQAKGIDMVNRAVSEMDKVTQQNAANAEESASASEELSAQAEHMMDYVNQLVRMVKGDGAQLSSGAANIKKKLVSARTSLKRPALSSSKSGRHSQGNVPSISGKAREVRPEDVIPLDNDDFTEF